MSKLLKNLIDGEKQFGKIMAILGALLMSALFIILIPYSLNDIFGKWTKIPGYITNSPSCDILPETKLFKCSPITISYKLKGKTETKTDYRGIISEKKYTNGEEINVWQEKQTDEISFLNQTPLGTGKQTLIIMTIMVILSWGWVWVTQNYSGGALAQGIVSTFDILA